MWFITTLEYLEYIADIYGRFWCSEATPQRITSGYLVSSRKKKGDHCGGKVRSDTTSLVLFSHIYNFEALKLISLLDAMRYICKLMSSTSIKAK